MHAMEVYEIHRFFKLDPMFKNISEEKGYQLREAFLRAHFEALITEEEIIYLIEKENRDVGFIWLMDLFSQVQIKRVYLQDIFCKRHLLRGIGAAFFKTPYGAKWAQRWGQEAKARFVYLLKRNSVSRRNIKSFTLEK